MKAVTVKEIKNELNHRSQKELMEFCLRLSKFKKENKELMTYLLFEAADEEEYIENVKREIDEQFKQVNKKSYYFIKKGIRKILFNTKKYIRYSQKKETQVDLLIYFCIQMKNFSPTYRRNVVLRNMFQRQINLIQKTVSSLHEDLQYDYEMELESLMTS